MTTMQAELVPEPILGPGARPPSSRARTASRHADAAAPGDAATPPSPDGVDLASRVRSGEGAAFTELFHRHGERIYNYCGRRTAWVDADDLTSEVFLTALKVCRRAPQDDDGLLAWLYAIATNVVRNHTRSGRRGSAAMARVGVHDDADDFSDALVAALDADARLRLALERLAQFPTTFQDAFHLVVWEGLSYEDAAQALDCPVGTIRSRISRVRAALRLTDEVAR